MLKSLTSLAVVDCSWPASGACICFLLHLLLWLLLYWSVAVIVQPAKLLPRANVLLSLLRDDVMLPIPRLTPSHGNTAVHRRIVRGVRVAVAAVSASLARCVDWWRCHCCMANGN